MDSMIDRFKKLNINSKFSITDQKINYKLFSNK